MASINDDIADELIDKDVTRLRVESGMNRKVKNKLKGLRQEAISQVERVDPTAPQYVVHKNRRTETLVLWSKKRADEVYRDIYRENAKDLTKLATLEEAGLVDAVNNTLQFELLTKKLDSRLARELEKDTLIKGAPSKLWWQSAGRKWAEDFAREMREGVKLNETIPQLTRRLRSLQGFTERRRREAEALVRTSVQAVANNAREATYAAHSNVIKGRQWLSTMDTRTSDICMALSGAAWDMNNKPINGSTTPWQGPPPAHFNCRSTLVPITKSFAELSKNPRLKRKLRNIDNNLRKKLDGGSAVPRTYEQWLRTKSEAKQIEVLGPTKHKLWKSRKISLKDLINQNHRPLTVDELVKKAES